MLTEASLRETSRARTGIDFAWPLELEALRSDAEDLAASWVGSGIERSDSWLIGYDRHLARELGRRGWIGMTWPREAGGQALTPLHRFAVYEPLIGAGVPIAAMWFADRQIGPTLLQYGSAEQQQRWLPGIISGDSAWCIGMSEPDAGSDVASLRTKAVLEGESWVVTGEKIWTSGAATADWCYLVVRTDPDAPKHAGLSELVVDMHSPGITVTPIQDMTGNRHFCQVHFDRVKVPADNLVGTRDGSFRQLMRQMEHERGGIDRLLSNRALYCDLLGSGLVDVRDPLVRQEMARLESHYRIGRLLVLREALGQAAPGFSAATKTWSTEFEQRVANFCLHSAEASGLLWGPEAGLGGRAARGVCYSPSYTIMGGTTEILRNVVAERLLGLPR